MAHSESTPGGVSRIGHSGHVATRASSGGTLPAWALGTRVALGGFRGKYHSLDSRRTRGLPGGSYVYGYSGHVALSEAMPERGGFERRFRRGGFRAGFWDTWHAPKGSERGLRRAFGVTFGTRVILRKAPKGVLPGGTSRRGFRRSFREGAFRAGFRRGFRKASSAGGPGRWIRDRRLSFKRGVQTV